MLTDEQFEDLFDRYISQKRDSMKNQYNRVLPTGELIFNRFDKGSYLNCGESSSIYDTSVVMGDVQIGEHVWVGPYTLLEGINGQLTIGDYTSIDAGVMIYTHDSTKHHVSLNGEEPFLTGDVSIGSHTVIGTMTMVSCGVSIGNHCVVGAHSFVNKDIPDCSIAMGTPARIVGHVQLCENGRVQFCYDEELGKMNYADDRDKLIDYYSQRFATQDLKFNMMGMLLDDQLINRRIKDFSMDSFYIFGTGPLGLQVYNATVNKCKILGFIDEDKQFYQNSNYAWGYRNLGLTVFSPEEVKAKYNGEKILLASFEELEKMRDVCKSFSDEKDIIYINEFLFGGAASDLYK